MTSTCLPSTSLIVHLVNTDGKGVEAITETGPVFAGKQYEVDAIIYATGFQYMTTGTFNTILGKGGLNLRDKWAPGTRTFLGFHVADFPNLFIMSGPQAAGANFNFMSLIEKQAEYLTDMLTHMRDVVHQTCVDVDKESEGVWAEHCADRDRSMGQFLRSTISYYNQEGTKRPGDLDYNGGMIYYKWQDEATTMMKGGPAGQLLKKNPYIFYS